ncbi:unnamed protein product [Schistocephalus solidus]|uniref:Uncharacterized protein n=1 Tax=Schistocephalus solidus TaxID=70667 RepID=A0A183SZS2_SCHSO|nr:unnamed protein product [Schistocephalus solidus]
MRVHVSGTHRDINTSCAPINTSVSPPMSSTSSTSSGAPQTQHLPTYLVVTATTPEHHASAWSVTCESIVQRPANQCQEHQHTPAAPDTTECNTLPLSNGPDHNRQNNGPVVNGRVLHSLTKGRGFEYRVINTWNGV